MAEILPTPKRDEVGRGTLIWLFIGIVALSCAIDLLFYSGYYASDDRRYLQPAWEILSEGGYRNDPGLAQGRLTIVGWNALVGWIFGFKIPLIAGSYVVFHQLLNLLTFALARRLFDDAVGLLAMYCMATTPLAVTFSTTVLPDLPLSCCLVLSLLLFLWSYDLRARGQAAHARLAILAAGVSVGFGYMAKETGLVVLPFYLVLWLCLETRRQPRAALVSGAAFAFGVLAVFIGEWLVLSYLSGHSHLRMAGAFEPGHAPAATYTSQYGYYPLERLTGVVGRLQLWFVNTRLDCFLVIAALAYPLLRGRKWSIWALALWFFAFHTWGSKRLTAYAPPPLQARYFTPLLPLLFIVYAFVVSRIWRAVPTVMRSVGLSRVVQAALLVALIAHPLPGLHVSDRMAGKVYSADKVNSSWEAIEAAQAGGGRPIVLSGTVTRYIQLLLEHDPREGVLTAEECRADAPALAELRERGFYYVELYSTRRFEEAKRPDGLDTLLHPLILATVTPDEPWLQQQNRVLGQVEVAGRRGVFRRLKRFDCWHKRTEQIAHAITPFAERHPDRYAWATYLYEWVPDAVAPQPEAD